MNSSQILGWAAILQPPDGWKGGSSHLAASLPWAHDRVYTPRSRNGFPVSLPPTQPTFCLSPPQSVSYILDGRHRRT